MSNEASKYQIRVFAEGERTEEVYLNHWWRENRAQVVVSIAPHTASTPMQLVRNAAAERKRDLRNAKKGNPFDEYWCVFDVDEHPNIAEALQMAAANSVKVALSGPCIELWFLIHFSKQTAELHRHEAQRQAKAYLGTDNKCLTSKALSLLDKNYKHALEHAQALDIRHRGDNKPTPWNPSSNLWQLAETIRCAKSIPGAGIPFA